MSERGKIKKLIQLYGNAMFELGAWEGDDAWEYKQLERVAAQRLYEVLVQCRQHPLAIDEVEVLARGNAD